MGRPGRYEAGLASVTRAGGWLAKCRGALRGTAPGLCVLGAWIDRQRLAVQDKIDVSACIVCRQDLLARLERPVTDTLLERRLA